VTWYPESLLRPWFPHDARTTTGRLRSAGSDRHPFPDVTATMRPSDFLTTFGLGSGSPRHRPTQTAGSGQDLPGYRAVLFVRATVTHPARSNTPLAPYRWCRYCLQVVKNPGHLERDVFGAAAPRLTRSRAYASPTRLPAPAQGSLPTCRAQLWSGRFRTRWTTNQVSVRCHPPPSPRTGLAWSHFTNVPRDTVPAPMSAMVAGGDSSSTRASWFTMRRSAQRCFEYPLPIRSYSGFMSSLCRGERDCCTTLLLRHTPGDLWVPGSFVQVPSQSEGWCLSGDSRRSS
jgi:hypothetical protein